MEAFAYISSHDLQEPLRKIASLTSWLQEKEHGNLSEKGAEYLNKINLSAERMKALIDDLLRYSRASLATIHFEETTLERAIAPVLEDLDEEIKRSKAAIQISGEGRLFVMEFQFRLMLHNLISNAIKFSKPGTQPQIRISLTHEFGQIDGMPFFKLEISDDGIGFDNAYNERIFSLFQRLTDDLKTAGTGIGLTIVKKIVDNHNGTVSAYGKPGHGATFTIRIPDQMLL